MKVVIIPYWMKMTLGHNGKTHKDVLDYSVLNKFFSKKDIFNFNLMNIYGFNDVIKPYLQLASFGGKELSLDTLLTPVGLQYSEINSADLDMYNESNLREAVIKYQTLLIGRALPENMTISFKCVEFYSSVEDGPVIALEVNLIEKPLSVKEAPMKTAEGIFDILIRNGYTLQTLTKAGLTGLLVTNHS